MDDCNGQGTGVSKDRDPLRDQRPRAGRRGDCAMGWDRRGAQYARSAQWRPPARVTQGKTRCMNPNRHVLAPALGMRAVSPSPHAAQLARTKLARAWRTPRQANVHSALDMYIDSAWRFASASASICAVHGSHRSAFENPPGCGVVDPQQASHQESYSACKRRTA